MELLNVALQIIAIIAIIAVGAFIIVFLSDLLISIIDNQQGIFFRRNKGKQEFYENTPTFESSKAYAQTATKSNEQVARSFNFDFDEEEKPSVKQEHIAPVSKKGSIDLELAKKEQELIEKANKNFFEDEDEEEVEEVESLEEKERKERIAKLEERNRQLEEELKKKEQALKEAPKPAAKEEPKPKMEETFEEDDTLDPYEKLIKQINKEVKDEFESSLQKEQPAKAPVQEPVKQEVKEERLAPKNRFANVNLFDFDEEEEEDEEEEIVEEPVEEKEDEKYVSLAQELQALKEQLERERAEREQIKLEANEIAQKLIEEKQVLEEALKAKKVSDVETKTVIVLDTEEEYVSRLELLEERLREAKKQLRNNKREFVPLNKIKRTLEKDQVKLRRKEAQVAKQKVALFGVNNSDIDPVKQAELEQEIDMLEGLKLSVQHCEDVMRENADRYPVLEQTHQILSKNVKNLMSDIETTNKKLQEVRKKKA